MVDFLILLAERPEAVGETFFCPGPSTTTLEEIQDLGAEALGLRPRTLHLSAAVLRTLAGVSATKRGFQLMPRRAGEVVVLARPVDEPHAAVLAVLADGESWSSSALALALGASQRTAQRALDSLATAGKVQSFGRGRARRWMTPPVPGFTTTLLLPAPLPE